MFLDLDNFEVYMLVILCIYYYWYYDVLSYYRTYIFLNRRGKPAYRRLILYISITAPDRAGMRRVADTGSISAITAP